jgi:HEAT repeat protein
MAGELSTPDQAASAAAQKSTVPSTLADVVAREGAMADMVAREAAIAGLLRQLSSGLSAYRLFPGDRRQPSFVAAVERVRAAAEKALAWGPVETEILGAHFRTASGPVMSDERIERLALACYQHRAERLFVRSIPDTRDLAVLYEALSTQSEEGTPEEGVGVALRVAGVSSIGVSELAPQATDADDQGFAPSVEQRALWQRLEDPEALAKDMLEEHLESILEQAQALFRRLQKLVALLPEKQAKSFELYRRLHDVVAELPDAVRRALALLLIQRAAEDPLAERFVGTMTDAELARMLVDLGVDGGPDPQELAAQLVAVGARRDDLIDLTMALLAGQEESGTILAGLERVGISVGPPAAESTVAETVSDLAARGLLSMGQDDVRAIREVFPHSDEEQGRLALAALQDYLGIELDLEQIGDVLTIWSHELSEALRERDQARVDRLLDAVEAVRAAADEADRGKRATVDAFLHRILDRPLLSELVSIEERDSASIIRLLRRFGEIGVECLLEDLAEEEERSRRALLLALLSEMARAHPGPVAARLSDPKWFVARNAVTILYRSGGPDVVPLLIQASRHPHQAVRREVVTGLLDAAGLDALPELVGLASDRDESVRVSVVRALGGMTSAEACSALGRLCLALSTPADRRRALEELGRHPAPEATDNLRDLAASRSRPRLPWRLRRVARAHVKQREAAAR